MNLVTYFFVNYIHVCKCFCLVFVHVQMAQFCYYIFVKPVCCFSNFYRLMFHLIIKDKIILLTRGIVNQLFFAAILFDFVFIHNFAAIYSLQTAVLDYAS